MTFEWNLISIVCLFVFAGLFGWWLPQQTFGLRAGPGPWCDCEQCREEWGE